MSYDELAALFSRYEMCINRGWHALRTCRRLTYSAMLMLFLLINSSVAAAAGLDIYLVRHAETEANASGVNNKQTSGEFSVTGLQQIAHLTTDLVRYQFDEILVSPTERTLNTIAPYLKKSGRVGVVWPEITECCWQGENGGVFEGQLVPGREIVLPPDVVQQFVFRDAASRVRYEGRNYADGMAQVQQAVKLIKARYFGSGKTILIVTHYHAGGLLMAQLLDVERAKLPGLINAGITHLQQMPDGSMALLMVNGTPVAR